MDAWSEIMDMGGRRLAQSVSHEAELAKSQSRSKADQVQLHCNMGHNAVADEAG